MKLMVNFFKKLMFARQLKFENGLINLLGEPIVMFPVYCMVDTLKELEKTNSANLLYRSFRELGIKWTENLIKNYGVKREEVFKVGSDVIAMAGYGIVKTLRINKKIPLIKFKLENSSLAAQYGHSNHPIDHLFRGMATGCMCVCYKNTNLECVEISCKAMGAPYCTFIIKPKKLFDLSDPFIKKQLS